MKTAVIVVFIVISIACAIESQSAKTARRIPKPVAEKRLCKDKECSISVTAPHRKRIVGGNEAIPHSWPWQVLIMSLDNKRKPLICGGSLISDRWIITAAHCFYEKKKKLDVLRDFIVLLGKHESKILEPTQQPNKIVSYDIHEKYDDAKIRNGYDIALLELAEPVKFTNAIQPISLPFGLLDLPFNKSCIATGWGDTKYGNNKLSEKLMKLSVTVMDEGSCSKLGVPTDRIFCTTTWDLNKDVCVGDSGGPLACQDADKKWYLRGVLAFAQGQCMQLAYFNKVVYFEEWIKNIISRQPSLLTTDYDG